MEPPLLCHSNPPQAGLSRKFPVLPLSKASRKIWGSIQMGPEWKKKKPEGAALGWNTTYLLNKNVGSSKIKVIFYQI